MKKILKVLLKKLGLYNIIVSKKKEYEQNNFRKYAPLFLVELGKKFEENNILYWLEYGTLLGAIREKKIIDYDYDIDIAVLKNEENLLKIEKIFKDNGFTKVHEIKLNEITTEKKYKKSNISIDIYIFTFEKNKFKGYCYGELENKSFTETLQLLNGFVTYKCEFNPFKTIDYEMYNQKFKIPENYMEHLAEYYGKDFMTPNSNWKQENAYNCIRLEKIGKLIKAENE